MAKTAKPRASSNGEGKKTRSKSKSYARLCALFPSARPCQLTPRGASPPRRPLSRSATKVKGAPSAWTQFRSRRTEELKKSDEQMDGAERLATIQEEWKTSDENPKNQQSSSS
ncbi:hypothetical protein JCM1841_002396 [Sporobolomyces salmonicolor]